MIDNLLTGFSNNPPNAGETFTYANVTVGTTVGTGTADIDFQNVSLSFPDLAHVSGSWSGNVVVKAATGVLFPGLLDIPVADGDDADGFAVVGSINLAAGNDSSNLALDDIDGEEIGVPSFLDVQLTNLAMNFADFRANPN